MRYVLQLSQENIGLSAYEASSLLELKSPSLRSNLLLAAISKENLKKLSRLAYTKKAFETLFQCKAGALEKSLLEYDWQKHYEKDFCLRIHLVGSSKKTYAEPDFARFIWRSLARNDIKPKVNLDNPHTGIEIFILKSDAFVCKKVFENLEHFEGRKAHMKPALHPTAMHPKMAKGLVNILNPHEGTSIIDPFCGAGGILLEASMMKIKSVGYDIDRPMLNRARINMLHYKIRPGLYRLVNKDSLTLKRVENVVTDLPYGKSSKKSSEIIGLYSRFIKKISGRSVIVFPDFVDYRRILRQNLSKRLKVKKIISYYVHKTLTRKIVVIDIR